MTADTDRDLLPIMTSALQIMRSRAAAELIWASPRERLNIFQAEGTGCHLITVTHDLLEKLDTVRQAAPGVSLDTVTMFHMVRAHRGFRLGLVAVVKDRRQSRDDKDIAYLDADRCETC